MPKRPIREKILATRRHCSVETCLHLSLLIQERLLGSSTYRQAGTIGLYSPVLNEVQTELVARHCFADAKRLAYPRVTATGLQFIAVSGFDELAPGTFGILEPTGDRQVAFAELDLLVVPGVAFDLFGHRLGYGKGYYDRALTQCRAGLDRVGFAYEFQVVDQLPAADHDCRLTGLVTEQRMLRFETEALNHHARGGAGC